MELTFRFAEEQDTPLILDFIRRLADYEHLLDQVVADEATLADQLFEKKNAEVLFALERDTARPSCKDWRPSPGSGAAAAWSGGVWTGTSPASAFTSPWVRNP